MPSDLRTVRRIAFVLLCANALSTAARAQAPARPGAVDDPYRRYTSPAQCVEAGRRMLQFYWRDKRQDTAAYAPASDSMPTIVRDSLQRCASRFSVATTAVPDLVPLVQLSLQTGDTAMAFGAAARVMSASAALPAGQRAWMMEEVVTSFLLAVPARPAPARHFLAALDALGAPAAYERMSAHRIMAGYAWSVGEIALADSESHAAVIAANAMGHADKLDLVDSMTLVALQRATILSAHRGAAPALASLDTAATVVLPLTQNGTSSAASLRQRIQNMLLAQRSPIEAVGSSAHTVHADELFSTPNDTIFPKRGRVTIVVFWRVDKSNFLTFAAIRRLHAAYADRGLDIVYLASTTGFFRTQIIPKPDDEARAFKQWFLDYLQLPVTVAVEESQFGRLLDGRRRNVAMTNEKNYGFGTMAVLVGKDGQVCFACDLLPENEAMYRQKIEAALAE